MLRGKTVTEKCQIRNLIF